MRVLLIAVLAGCALTLAAAHPASAAGKPPCWKQLLNDWYDGRIDNVYPIPCYNQALAHLPTDVQVYSSARDDIQRALASAIRNEKNGGSGQDAGGSGGSDGSGTSGGSGGETGGDTTSDGRESSNGPFGEAVDKITPGSAESLPLPLLILGALALLLVGAGIAGLVVRRMQARGQTL